MRVIALALLLAAVQEKRSPVPSDADQKAAEKVVRELFKDEYRGKDLASRRLLAEKLLAKAAEAKDDPPARYALLKECREVALQSTDWGLALRASNQLIESYALDGAAFRTGVLDRIAKSPIDSPGTARSAAEACLALTDLFVAADDYEHASRAIQAADAPTRAAKDALLPILARTRAADVGLMRSEYSKVRQAEKTLQDNPDDAAAALALGKFLCYVKRDWGRGLPLLSRGSDSRLKFLASQELSDPGDTAARAAVGNGWWAVGEEQSAAVRPGIRDHALLWLGRAWPTADAALKPSIREKMKVSWTKPGAKAPASAKAASSVPAPWGLMGTIPTTLEETPAHLGSYSIRVGGLSSPRIPARPGEEYLLSGWILSDANEGATDCLRLDFLSADGKWFGADGPELQVDRPMWTFVSKTVTCPANTAAITVVSFRSKAVGSFWVDDISLKKVGEDRELVRNGSFEDK